MLALNAMPFFILKNSPMRKVIFPFFLLALAFAFFSCEKCIKCEIQGKNYQDSVYFDSVKIVYPEFCGTPSEVDAFQADVEYAANSRKCIIYSIRRVVDNTPLLTSTMCGNAKDQEVFTAQLDSIMEYVYPDLDVELSIDTIISNPAKWECK